MSERENEIEATHWTQQALDELVDQADGVVVLFTEGGCRVAEAIEPKLEAMLDEHFPKLRRVVIAKDEAPELLAQMNVFVFPTVVAYFGGRETTRFVRNFSLEEVGMAIERPYEILFGDA